MGSEDGIGFESIRETPDLPIVSLLYHTAPVYALSQNSLKPEWIVSGGGDDIAILWKQISPTEVQPVHILRGHSDSVVALGFNFDGTLVATGGYDGLVKIWSVDTGTCMTTLEGPSEEVEWIQWHQKGDVILAGSGDGTVWMWLATTAVCMHVFAGHEASVTCGSFSPSGKVCYFFMCVFFGCFH